jgi:hypothetical protein
VWTAVAALASVVVPPTCRLVKAVVPPTMPPKLALPVIARDCVPLTVPAKETVPPLLVSVVLADSVTGSL